ncbi:VPS35 endosomal protein-sorting factor-like [Neodiprion virginianus]|uniref:VPS35 endosomal protein-sorting factor-like n=1 Tax=Neodiprion fabricii TaxID=2872261 RepID=UPI001ED9639C|nr:VPS35 endosomal protein-sorting factor-like [Neodiprion fabricii]XP_046425184.1 VPS35 endosomal protein-sorting factor-like [Neodiprion fabricii]XP_046425185.1 VPS35 endosomal protein-sorting factor-like [Neodiprion fabricii]XP_046425187.1 VPS35 endosomal protein-sorting factor-like [Neodiprion fabricii]XP_046619006.1 VPS35 endosomal protein-sorting factor-like [Neodiprion virginianus]XP_046619007.1 VPS35 endosomal protein-sorting factor-like [Neodiprion virginianus]XP_046619008.1 VPS35 en
MFEIEWSACPLNQGLLRVPHSEEVTEHPLNPITVTMTDGRGGFRRGTIRSSSTGSSTGTPTPTHAPVPVTNLFSDQLLNHSSFDGSDPLSQFARQDLDPLSKMAADEWDYSANVTSVGKKSKVVADDLAEPWQARRAAILTKYTTSEKLSIVTSFLPGGEKVIVKVQPSGTMVDKVRTRLEQLDDFEEGSVRQMLDLTQQEYAARIELLNNELVQAWHSDQRVKALKIAIQCAKLLGDTAAMAFYPSKFVLITDILDIFGKLVYERLKMKAEYYKPGSKVVTCLPDNFTPEMVPESAKETCRNWFYKIASIRELVPRLYVEMAIIKSYSYLTSSEFSTALLRITRMIRGIGNPLIAVYARCYLCRVGLALNQSTDLGFVKENFYDFLSTYGQLFSQTIKADLNKQNIPTSSYLNLYTPALDWILQVMASSAPESLLIEILARCKQESNSGLLLNTILSAFKSTYIASRPMEFVNLIMSCNEEGFPQHLLYRRLGQCLIQESLPKEDCKPVLNAVWQYVANLKDPVKFMQCAEIWIQFTVIYFSVTEVNFILGEIISHLIPNRAFEQHYSQMQTIVDKVVAHTQDYESLLTMENFLPLIDLFHKESIKVDVCKTIIDGLSSQPGLINDPIVINALMFIARIIHDSVSALTVDDEKRQIGNLICGLVQRIDYGRDFEKQLSFYAEARAAFPNLDSVHIQLVQCVNRLSVDTRKIVRGHHTRRTSAFVRACAAFCFITIPSLTLVHTRLQLYLLSGQVALLNQCLGQADACFKAALSLVPEMPKTIELDGRQKSSEPYLLSYLSSFLSTLLVVPDSPEHGVLYLMRGLLNAVQRCFEANSSSKSYLYLRVLDLLSTVTQENYPYHVDKVESNDTLYGSDKKFINEVDKISSKVFEEILNHLKYLGSSDQHGKQSVLALELFCRLIMRADLRQPPLATIAINLWKLSQRHGSADPKLSVQTIEYMKNRSQLVVFDHFPELLKKMLNT